MRLIVASFFSVASFGERPKDIQQFWWPQDVEGPIVETEHGLVEGSTRHPLNPLKDFSSVDGFFGIPYADPPLYMNRFRAPQPYSSPWGNTTRQAKKLASACPQWDTVGKVHIGDENCLYLNVYRPTGTPAGANKPVLFWIYGGGFWFGDSYNGMGNGIPVGLYDAFNVVQRQKHVVVSHNYRLNMAGFLALPELASEDPSGSMGNWAMLDQRAALQWTHRNIRQFGGDPNQITINGESAGGISVVWHLTSPQSRGLFHAAIIQSATTKSEWFFHKKEFALEFYQEWSKILGCEGPGRLQCLRELPQEKLMVPVGQWVEDWFARYAGLPLPPDVPAIAAPLFPAVAFAPVIAGTDADLHDFPAHLMDRGEFAKVPIILGYNKDDGAYFGPLMPLLWGGFPFFGYDLGRLAEWFLPDERDRQKLLMYYGEEYGGFPPSNAWHKDAFKRFFRDAMFLCDTRDMATAWSNYGLPAFTYAFSFDYHDGFPLNTLGDPHAFEMVFTWRNGVNFWGDLRFDEAKYLRMADIMSCMWSSFVVCQKPRCDTPIPNCKEALDSLIEWPLFNANSSRREYLNIKLPDPEIRVVPATAKFGADVFAGDDRCDFWKTANMDWQGIRKGLSHPNFEGCGADGECLKSTSHEGEFGCCSGIKHTAGSCISQIKCGCIPDGQCMDIRNEATECCSGVKSTVLPIICPSLKRCGSRVSNTTLV